MPATRCRHWSHDTVSVCLIFQVRLSRIRINQEHPLEHPPCPRQGGCTPFSIHSQTKCQIPPVKTHTTHILWFPQSTSLDLRPSTRTHASNFHQSILTPQRPRRTRLKSNLTKEYTVITELRFLGNEDRLSCYSIGRWFANRIRDEYDMDTGKEDGSWWI